MEKENDVFEEFMRGYSTIEPIDRILLQILRGNPNIKASFNKKLGVWDFYGKRGEQFRPPNTCEYVNQQLILYNGDGTTTLVGNFHIS